MMAPMSIATDPFSIDHRLTRFLTVVWLRLMRMLGNLLTGEAPYRDELNAMSRFLAAFILIRACRQLGPKPPLTRRHERPANAPSGFARRKCIKRFAFVRIAVGAKLWRGLRGRSAFAHIAALIRAILNRDALAAEVAARLKHGLTRLNPLVLTHAISDAAPALRASATLAADTS